MTWSEINRVRLAATRLLRYRTVMRAALTSFASLVSLAAAVLVVACTTTTTSVPSNVGDAGPGSEGPDGEGPGGDAGGEEPGSEGLAVCNGLVSCDAECTSLEDDAAHCGACGTACAEGSICRSGSCQATTCTGSYAECGTRCIQLRMDPMNCGACGTACGAKETCHDGACVSVFGAGNSCADPIVLPGGGENVEIPFTFANANETQLLTCGEPVARPRKVFRFTAQSSIERPSFEIRGGLPTDDLVLELFGDATCGASASLGCSDDYQGDKRPRLEVPVQAGKTYFVVVSSKGPPPAGVFRLRFDD